jgi:hypothetical protein
MKSWSEIGNPDVNYTNPKSKNLSLLAAIDEN